MFVPVGHLLPHRPAVDVTQVTFVQLEPSRMNRVRSLRSTISGKRKRWNTVKSVHLGGIASLLQTFLDHSLHLRDDVVTGFTVLTESHLSVKRDISAQVRLTSRRCKSLVHRASIKRKKGRVHAKPVKPDTTAIHLKMKVVWSLKKTVLLAIIAQRRLSSNTNFLVKSVPCEVQSMAKDQMTVTHVPLVLFVLIGPKIRYLAIVSRGSSVAKVQRYQTLKQVKQVIQMTMT